MKTVFVIILMIALFTIVAGIVSYKSSKEDTSEAIAECAVGVLLVIFNMVAGAVFKVF